MKKVLTALFVLTMLLFAACGNDVPSVDLSQITFDGVTVGDDFNKIETEKYTPSDRYPESENLYAFEEWRVRVDGDLITEITASYPLIDISVNGKKDCFALEDVTNILGDGYVSSWYDREQSLMQIEYADKENALKCAFVYDKNGGNLVFAIMQKTP